MAQLVYPGGSTKKWPLACLEPMPSAAITIEDRLKAGHFGSLCDRPMREACKTGFFPPGSKPSRTRADSMSGVFFRFTVDKGLGPELPRRISPEIEFVNQEENQVVVAFVSAAA